MSLTLLRAEIGTHCTRCTLQEFRSQVVFGAGPEDARIMLVGEAPGAQEDASGTPFVGASGKRLNEWLQRLGIPREKVFISNICKCRPLSNRKPSSNEVATCSPFLQRQIAIIQPRLLLALGGTAANFMSGMNDSLKSLRAKELWYTQEGIRIPLGVTYHPSYVLQYDPTGAVQAMVLEDLTRAIRRVSLGIAPNADPPQD